MKDHGLQSHHAISLAIWEKIVGGFGSGRKFGRPTVEGSLNINLAWMMRTGHVVQGKDVSGTLNWSQGGHPITHVDYTACMTNAGAERLELFCTGGELLQSVRLVHTFPNFGGKRWWIVCPYQNVLVNSIYLPPGGKQFASRKAYRLAYQSERVTEQQRTLDRLFALQEKLGCRRGLGVPPQRPKGMWHRTYKRHEKQYRELEAKAAAEFLLTDAFLQSVW